MKTIKILFLIIFLSSISCSRDDNDEFKPVIPNNEVVLDTAFYEDGEVETIFENDRINGINVVILGDGYIQNDLGKKIGTYKPKLDAQIDFLFNQEPFKTYRDFFNVYLVYVESPTDRSEDTTSETAFNLGVINGSFVYDSEKISSYTQSAVGPGREVHLKLVTTQYGINGKAILGDIGFFSEDKFQTMLHEVGHAFGSLGDEYENNFPNPDRYANQDDTDNLEDIEWSHFIGLPGYERIGAAYHSPGVWIPSSYSIMGGDDLFPFFTAPSREVIVKRIYEIVGLTYSFDAFLNNDVLPNTNRNAIKMKNDIVCAGATKS